LVKLNQEKEEKGKRVPAPFGTLVGHQGGKKKKWGNLPLEGQPTFVERKKEGKVVEARVEKEKHRR